MAAKRSKQKAGRPSAAQRAADIVLEEVIDASLHPDRAHHNEIGRTEEPSEPTLPSPREQPAEPLDIRRVDE